MKPGKLFAVIICLFLVLGGANLYGQEKGKKRNPDRISVSTAKDPEKKPAENTDEDSSYVMLDFEADPTDNRTFSQKLFGYRSDDEDKIDPYTTFIFRGGATIIWWNDDQYKEINPVDFVCASFSFGWLDPWDFDYLPARLHYTIEVNYMKSVKDSSSMLWNATGDTYFNISITGIGGGTSIMYDLSRSIYARGGIGFTRWTKDTIVTTKSTTGDINKYPSGQKLYVLYIDMNLGYRQFITDKLFIGAEGGACFSPKYAYPSLGITMSCGYAL